MLKRIVGAALCAIALAVPPAVAEEYATGWIAAVDRETDRITLDSGEVFIVSGDLNLSTLSEGIEVRVAFERTKQGKIATRVVPAARPAPRKARQGGV